jgi:cobalt/nickel transport system permease protein
MHIPDGFIAPVMYAPAYGVAGALWAYCLRRLKREVDEQTVPILAAVTALCFVLMMVAIPLPGGTTAHATGIALLTLLFGIPVAFLSLSLVLLLQAVMFGDGGITSLPINALAIGLGGGIAARLVFGAVRRAYERVALFAAAWCSVMVPALLVALALGVQPLIAHNSDGTPLFFPFGLRVTLPAVLVPHALMGVGEGILTILVYRLVKQLRDRNAP